jgi:hypothetical protein
MFFPPFYNHLNAILLSGTFYYRWWVQVLGVFKVFPPVGNIRELKISDL